MEQPSVWLEFSPLAKLTKSINLGQGFPDWAPPKFVEQAAISSVTGGKFNGYARSAGHFPLVQTLSHTYSSQLNRELNPTQEIIITAGATEALYLSIISFVKPDDEVIIIEPAFDIYLGALKMAKANIKTIALDDDLKLDLEQLGKLINKKTKMLILNTPHNPSGKVFNQQELASIATLVQAQPDCIILSDEVYEHLVYDENQHISIASLPGMFERTITISSAGKTFSTTGWKIGWAIGPKELIGKLMHTHQWVMFSVSTPHQEAIAQSVLKAQELGYYDYLRDDYQQKRDLLFKGLKDSGLNPIKPQGSFFILCDISSNNINNPNDIEKIKTWVNEHKLQVDTTTYELKDYNFSRSLSLHHGVTAIPTSAFYLNKEDNQKWARFAFCKSNETLSLAIERMKKL